MLALAQSAPIPGVVEENESTARIPPLNRAEISNESVYWEQTQLLLDGRRLALIRRIRDSLSGVQNLLSTKMLADVARAPDPQQYWESDMPIRMRSILRENVNRTRNLLLDGMAEDISWLEARLREKFGLDVSVAKPAAPASEVQLLPDELSIELKWEQTAASKRNQLLSRVGADAGALLGFLIGLLGGVGVPENHARTAGGLLAEAAGQTVLRSAVVRQRKIINDQVPRFAQRAIADFVEEISHNVDSLYSRILDETRRIRRAWEEARQDNLNGVMPGVSHDRNLVAEIDALRHQIHNALQLRAAELT